MRKGLKIIGITYYDGCENVVLKSDSSLTVNRKPLFVPEAITDLQALPCWVLRVSRLGKCIAPRFASRYYDAVAAGVDFFGADKLQAAKAAGKPWTEAIAFEGSLAVGEMSEVRCQKSDAKWRVVREDEQIEELEWGGDLREVFDQAVARVSELLTIRQGDLIYVAHNEQPWQMQMNDVIRACSGDDELLYCKIK